SPSHTLLLLCLVQLVAIAAMEMSGPFWPLYLSSMPSVDANNIHYWSSAAYIFPLIGAMLSAPFWGSIGDRIGHKYMIMRALAALALTQLLIAMAPTPFLVIIARFLQGLFAGFIAAAQAYAALSSHSDRRATLFGYLQGSTAAGTLVGPIIGGWLANHYDYTFVFIIACSLCVFAFFVVTFFFKHDALLPPFSITKQSKKKNKTSPFSSLWLLLLLISFIQIAKMAPLSYFTIFVEQEISSDKLIIGLLYASSGLTLMISAPLWGRLLDRRPGFIIVAALMAAMGIAAQAWAQSILACLLARLWWGACLGAFLPFLIAQVSLLRSENTQGKLIGFGHSAIKLGGAMGVLLGGLLASILGERYSFLCIGGLYLGIACIFIHQFLPTKKIRISNI
ncbi:MAG: MFS family permease, partial [Kiritimatiellia bacterium]